VAAGWVLDLYNFVALRNDGVALYLDPPPELETMAIGGANKVKHGASLQLKVVVLSRADPVRLAHKPASDNRGRLVEEIARLGRCSL